MNCAALFAVFSICSLMPLVLGHGYMIEPAARNACYKLFKECKANYNANQQFCGGREAQISNNGKCGVCGDSYSAPIPPHVYPGKYATGFITKTYTQGQQITVKVKITANHKGWFEYRVGNIGTPPITQAKLIYLLKSPSGQTRFTLLPDTWATSHELMLPLDLSCDHCVLQWWWRTANSWGCSVEECGLGHGAQETFVNCADVRILPRGNSIKATMSSTQTPTLPPQSTNQVNASPKPLSSSASQIHSPVPLSSSTNQINSSPVRPLPSSTNQMSSSIEVPHPSPSPTTGPPGPEECRSTGAWAGDASVDKWCVTNCAAGYCPAHMCVCGPAPPTIPTPTCKAIDVWEGDAAMDRWCKNNCAAGFCPENMCICS